jgi:uncharacterized radical SAM superfamily protein
VTLTGGECALNCAHCGGHYLKGMVPADAVPDATAVQADASFCASPGGLPGASPGALPGASFDATPGAREWMEVKSCLVSGGCDGTGRVPVLAHKARLLELRARYRLNMHVGLVSPDEARELGELADAVSFDLVGDDATIHEVYGLDRNVGDYLAAFDALRAQVSKVVRHVCIGLRGGRLSGERQALDFLVERQVEAVAFIVFMPTPGTRFAAVEPPSLTEVAGFLAEARLLLPRAELHLGCMRPKGHYRAWLDLLAVRAGVNRIVQPTPWARELALSLGLTLVPADECCVF